ncbi:MAG: transglutaminase-like putative cysteine protease [Pirellulaceae bacterium]
MRYKVVHTTNYEYSEVVPVCQNVIHLAPRNLPRQKCDDFRLVIQPEPLNLEHRMDYFGNQASHFSIERPHRGLTVAAMSQVVVFPPPKISPAETPPWEDVAFRIGDERSVAALDAYQFTIESKAIGQFEELGEYARKSFTRGRSILDAALELTHRIYQDFAFDTKATNIYTQVKEVFEKRQGVCQDFAHLQIGCIRSLGLAARYVSGYLRTIPPPGKTRLVGADASHAWLSVYCGEKGWVDVDPTNNARASTDYVTVAWGRDYGDVCPIQGVIVGGGKHNMSVSVDVEPVEPVPTP